MYTYMYILIHAYTYVEVDLLREDELVLGREGINKIMYNLKKTTKQKKQDVLLVYIVTICIVSNVLCFM